MSVIGIENAIDRLRIAGFRNSDISVLMPVLAGKHGGLISREAASGFRNISWLAGAGSLAIPGVGSFFAAGPIITELTGSRSISGLCIKFGIEEYIAKRYEDRLSRGDILLIVHCNEIDFIKRTKHIFEDTGAEDVGASDHDLQTVDGVALKSGEKTTPVGCAKYMNQKRRLICGVISALNAANRFSISVTQEHIEKACEHLESTQTGGILKVLDVAVYIEEFWENGKSPAPLYPDATISDSNHSIKTELNRALDAAAGGRRDANDLKCGGHG